MKKLSTFLCIAVFPILCFAQTDIADARTYSLGASVTVTGIVTNGSELGPIRYIQDGSAGIACYPGTGSVSFNPAKGDTVTVSGTLKDYNNLLEIDPVTAITTNSTGNPLPSPQVITPSQQDETTEAELVQINNAIFADGGSTFAGNTNYNFTSSSQTGQVRINSGSNLVGTLIPVGAVNIVGIASQYLSTYQLLPRDLNDIVLLGSLFMTSALSVSNITTASVDLNWTTNAVSESTLRYGLTTLFELGEVNDPSMVTAHIVSLSGLTAATIYYIQAYSVSGTDTAFSAVKVISTASNSTGMIRAFFNHPVDTSESLGTYASYVPDFPDTIIAYIGKATGTLDICMYNNNNLNIVSAINAAYNSGVKVRYVTNLTTLNSALGSLDPGIAVIKGNNDGIMHNKFVVIDRDDVNNAWALTGSTNWTPNNLYDDYNNMICIQDQAVARAYTLEFEEFWGDTGLVPNTLNSKFGSAKTDNTPHEFMVGGNPLEVYFSPSDLTTGKIQAAIESADASLEFALLSFTKNELGTAVKYANDAFGNVKGIMENISDQGEEYTYLTSNGVSVLSHQGVQYDFHHKYAIIDQANTASDPLVLTGSHNWSTAAETKNDENTVFVHNADIANQYYQEFMARYCELTSCVPPVASFTYNYAGAGFTSFTDASANYPTIWAWDFGDGNTSTAQNPTNVYSVLDTTYYVCLTATNGLGSDTYCDSVYADTSTVLPVPAASFSFTHLGGGVTDFTDNSTNSPSSWSWDFGDGNTSTAQNPTHTYADIDTTFYVCLTATNGFGSDTYCDSVYIDTTSVAPGMNEANSDISFLVFPNPNSGEFTIDITLAKPMEVSIQVLDMAARVVQAESFIAGTGRNIKVLHSALTAGSYILEVSVNGTGYFLPMIITP